MPAGAACTRALAQTATATTDPALRGGAAAAAALPAVVGQRSWPLAPLFLTALAPVMHSSRSLRATPPPSMRMPAPLQGPSIHARLGAAAAGARRHRGASERGRSGRWRPRPLCAAGPAQLRAPARHGGQCRGAGGGRGAAGPCGVTMAGPHRGSPAHSRGAPTPPAPPTRQGAGQVRLRLRHAAGRPRQPRRLTRHPPRCVGGSCRPPAAAGTPRAPLGGPCRPPPPYPRRRRSRSRSFRTSPRPAPRPGLPNGRRSAARLGRGA